MDWLFLRCPWCETTWREEAGSAGHSCPSCDSQLEAVDEPQDGIWVTNAQDDRDPLIPGLPTPPVAVDVATLSGLGKPTAALFANGTPILLSASADSAADHLAAALHITDALRLAARVPLSVTSSEDDAGAVKMRIEQLGASGEGPNRGLALAALAADARIRSNQVLADPMSTADLRDAALLVWISDCAGGLARLVEAGV